MYGCFFVFNDKFNIQVKYVLVKYGAQVKYMFRDQIDILVH